MLLRLIRPRCKKGNCRFARLIDAQNNHLLSSTAPQLFLLIVSDLESRPASQINQDAFFYVGDPNIRRLPRRCLLPRRCAPPSALTMFTNLLLSTVA